jgi:hypothetical protein
MNLRCVHRIRTFSLPSRPVGPAGGGISTPPKQAQRAKHSPAKGEALDTGPKTLRQTEGLPPNPDGSPCLRVDIFRQEDMVCPNYKNRGRCSFRLSFTSRLSHVPVPATRPPPAPEEEGQGEEVRKPRGSRDRDGSRTASPPVETRPSRRRNPRTHAQGIAVVGAKTGIHILREAPATC